MSCFPDVPEIEAAYRTAFRALEKLAPQNAAWVHEADADFSEILSQFWWVTKEAEMAVAGALGPRITWTGEHQEGNWDPIIAGADLDDPGRRDFGAALGDSAIQGDDGTWSGSALDQAGRAYRRAAGWDFPPGDAGVWLLMLAPVTAMGSGSDEPWFFSGHVAGFLVLYDRDEDGRYESAGHVWTASAWRRRGIARRLLREARSRFGARNIEGPYTEDGAAFAKACAPKVSFRQWLKQFTGKQSAIGDLARDVLADSDWPRGPSSLSRYEAYLAGAGACADVLEALRAAWARYERERQGGR